MGFINDYLFPGLVSGSIYALAAVGLTLVFGIMRFANLAQGDLLTVGLFGGVFAMRTFHVGPYWTIPIAVAVGAVAALVVDQAVFRPLRGRSSTTLLLASFGAALMLRAIVLILFGPGAFAFDRRLQFPTEVLGLEFSPRQLTVLVAALAAALLVHLVLAHTRVGYAMRAMSDNTALARLCGVPVERTISWTWIMAGGLAGAAGVLLALNAQASPFLGYNILLPTFAATILGGLGNPYGAILGGFVVGIAEEISVFPVLGDHGLVEPTYKAAVSFTLLIVLLLFRPQGLLGRPTR